MSTFGNAYPIVLTRLLSDSSFRTPSPIITPKIVGSVVLEKRIPLNVSINSKGNESKSAFLKKIFLYRLILTKMQIKSKKRDTI